MADIEIGSLSDLKNLLTGAYGYGQSSAYLDVALTTDLDFADLGEGVDWYTWLGVSSIPTSSWYIYFDGRGHQIKNIAYNGNKRWFFLTNIQNGYVANVWFKDINVFSTGQGDTSNKRMSLFRNIYNNTIIQNVHVTGEFNMPGGVVAGICLYTNNNGPQIRECSFSGNLIGDKVGGITYDPAAVASIVNSCVVGTIRATTDASSISHNATRIINCFFRGAIQAPTIYAITKDANYAVNCYVVFYSGTSNTIQAVSQNNCLYDSTIAAAEGITVPSLNAATTAQLQNVSFLLNAGFDIAGA